MTRIPTYGLIAGVCLLLAGSTCKPIAAHDQVSRPAGVQTAVYTTPTVLGAPAPVTTVAVRRYGAYYPPRVVYRSNYAVPYAAPQPYYGGYYAPYYAPAPYSYYGGYPGYYAPYGTFYRGPVFRGGYYW